MFEFRSLDRNFSRSVSGFCSRFPDFCSHIFHFWEVYKFFFHKNFKLGGKLLDDKKILREICHHDGKFTINLPTIYNQNCQAVFFLFQSLVLSSFEKSFSCHILSESKNSIFFLKFYCVFLSNFQSNFIITHFFYLDHKSKIRYPKYSLITF